MAITSEDRAALVAAPAKTSLMGVDSLRPIALIQKPKTEIIAAPIKANHIYSLALLILKKAIPQTINNDAPVLTPRILGSAIGLRVAACIRAPETPRAPPQHKLKMVRGILLRTIFASYESMF